MDFAQFRHDVRTWLAANPPARAERIPHDEASLADEFAFLRDWQRRLHAAGYVGLLWPRTYGGRGAHPAALAILNEELARARAPQLLNRVGINNTGPTLIACGTEDQKRRYLPRILPADEIGFQLFSEPGDGRDLAALPPRDQPAGDGLHRIQRGVPRSRAGGAREARRHREPGLGHRDDDARARARHRLRVQGAGSAADRARGRNRARTHAAARGRSRRPPGDRATLDRRRDHAALQLAHADAARARRGAGPGIVAREALLGGADTTPPRARPRARGTARAARRGPLAAGVALVASRLDRGWHVRGAGQHHRAASARPAAVRSRSRLDHPTPLRVYVE